QVPQESVGEARAVAMAAPQAEVDCCADQQGPVIQVCDDRRHRGLCDDIEDRARCRISQQGQADKFVDADAIELRTDLVVCSLRLCLRRGSRNLETRITQAIEARGEPTIGLLEGPTDVCHEAGDRASLDYRYRPG